MLYPGFPSGHIFVVYKPKLIIVSSFPFGVVCSNNLNFIKALFIIPTDAHNYKIIGMLKQLKFRQLLRHVSVHAGTIIRELFRA